MMAASTLTKQLLSVEQQARQAYAKAKQVGPGVVCAIIMCASWYRTDSKLAALGVGLVCWLLFRFAGFAWWARIRRTALVAADAPVPPIKQLWKTYKLEQKRLDYIQKHWASRCIMHGVHSNKQTPLLVDLKPTLESDFTARIPRTGFDPDDIKTKAPKIAKGLGCSGGIVVRETAAGMADITFNWSNPIRRELPLRDVPMPKNGGISFGVTEFGDPAELRMDASKVFVGVQGSGKSVGAEAALASLVTRGEYVRLRVSNPKKNEMRMFKEFEKRAMGRLEVRAYAESEADNIKLVTDAAHAMSVRAGMMKGRKLTKTSAENPLDILWLDEMMMLPKSVYKDGPYSPLGQIALAGRASLNVVWGCTQMFYASEFGSLRGLFDERILMRVKTSLQNDMVIEDATRRGALAHRIHPTLERGVGYIEDEHGQLTKFRAGKVEDEDLARTIRGLPIEGMATEAPKKDAKPTSQSVYFIEAAGTDLVKIGIAAVPKDRLRELQTASPHKLSILATMPGGKVAESRLHRHFAASRATGEWFHRTPELDALIADVQAGNGDAGGGGHTRLQQVRHMPTATREWVARNAHNITTRRDPEPSNKEIAAAMTPQQFPGTDFHGGQTAAVWSE
jgi:hypothetical protein